MSISGAGYKIIQVSGGSGVTNPTLNTLPNGNIELIVDGVVTWTIPASVNLNTEVGATQVADYATPAGPVGAPTPDVDGDIFIQGYGSSIEYWIASGGAFSGASDVSIPVGVSSNYESDYLVAAWTVGTPNTLSIPQATHGLTASKVYHVTVVDTATNTIVAVETEIVATGDITLKTASPAFDLTVKVS